MAMVLAPRTDIPHLFFSRATSSVVAARHNLTAPLKLTTASILPSRENPTELTIDKSPLGEAISWPVRVSHNFTVASWLPVASVLPSGENATEVIDPECPFKVNANRRVLMSHNSTKYSSSFEADCPKLATASIFPSGESATGPLVDRALSAGKSCRVFTSHSFKVPLLVKSVFPSRENVTNLTWDESPFSPDCSCLVCVSHSFRLPYSLQTASVPPSGEKATHSIEEAFRSSPLSGASSFQVFVSHNFTVLSLLPVASILPSAENAIALTSPEWPVGIVFSFCRLLVSHSSTFLPLPTASVPSSGESADAKTPQDC